MKAFTRELRLPRPGEVQAFLSRQGVRKLESMANGELRFSPCPSCQNQKRSGAIRSGTSADVNPKTGLGRCFACGARWNWLTLTRAFGAELPRSDRYKDQKPEDLWKLRDLFKEQKRRLVSGGHHPALLAYWLARGIQAETLDAFLATSCGPETTRWPLHAWDKGGWQMVNAKLKKCLNLKEDEARSRFEKAGGPTSLALGQHLISAAHGERIFIWEGEIDAMSAWQIGLKNSVSLPNGASAVNVGGLLRYIPDDWQVYLGMDMDEAGDRAVEAFFAQVDPRRLVRFVLPSNPTDIDSEGKARPFKDLNAWLKAKPDLSADDVMATAVGIGIARVPAPRKPVTLGQVRLQVSNRSEAKPRLVCSLPWQGLNAMFKGGLLGKQTTGLLAPSGVGKTSLMNQIVVHAAGMGCKSGLISLEDSRDELHDNLNQVAMGWLDIEGIGRAADNLWISQLEGSGTSWEDCLGEMERMAQDGVRLIVMDNLDHIADRSNSHRGMDMKITAYAAMIELAKQFDLHVIAVWQCNKVDRGQVVNSGNQKGYGQTFLDAANYLNMNRMVVGGEERTRLEIEKARSAGTRFVNSHVWLQYMESKRCFFEVVGNVVQMPSQGDPGLPGF